MSGLGNEISDLHLAGQFVMSTQFNTPYGDYPLKGSFPKKGEV